MSTNNKQVNLQTSGERGKGTGRGGMGQCSKEIVDYKCLVLPNPDIETHPAMDRKIKKSSQLRKPKFILSHIPYVPSLSYKHKHWASHGGWLINRGQQTLWNEPIGILF